MHERRENRRGGLIMIRSLLYTAAAWLLVWCWLALTVTAP
jgi:hypothetical protein